MHTVDAAQLRRIEECRAQVLQAASVRGQEALVTLAGQIAMAASQPAAGSRPGAPSARGRRSRICYRWDGTPGSCDRGANCPWPHPPAAFVPASRARLPHLQLRRQAEWGRGYSKQYLAMMRGWLKSQNHLALMRGWLMCQSNPFYLGSSLLK